jgi:hypothetical protein
MPIDYKQYPANWLTEIRPQILARDGHRCKHCNVPNHLVIKRLKGESYCTPGAQDWDMINSRVKYSHSNLTESLKHHGFTKIVLTIANLDHDHINCDNDNLAALCQRCHLKLDKHQHANNRSYGRNWKRDQIKLDL